MHGELRNSDTKSNIVKEFEKYVEPSTSRPQSTAKVVDGAAAVSAITPREPNNFEQNFRQDFAGYIRHRFQQHGLRHTGVVSDVYLKQSIKSAT